MSYQIKHMGLGGILDQAIAVVRDNFVLLFSIMLMTLIPLFLVQGFLLLAITPELPPDATMQEILDARRVQASYWPWTTGVSLLYLFVALPVANAAVIQAIARSYLGQPITAIDAIKHALRRFFPLIGTTVLIYLAIWGGLILLIIPGIYFAIWFGLSQHVVVIEGIAGTKALKRSKKLVHKDRGTFLALAIIVTVISFMVSMGSSYIPQPHVRVVGASLIQALTTMLWAAAFVVFYFSCRCGVENFDLHFLAEQINAEQINAEPTEIGQTAVASRMS
jgi:hypothetical protein